MIAGLCVNGEIRFVKEGTGLCVNGAAKGTLRGASLFYGMRVSRQSSIAAFFLLISEITAISNFGSRVS